ncbi:DNA-binding protein H-NS [Pelomonas aquatica]|uniref:DNA-binding protein H-NS n=1 Tax=Pelomonas aquatica TaxID=431058 RepID=A0ABU1ZHH0_9BURK|nr:H-NS histone family protein [Pelomonas aquatica]MDR7299506.1 DNA-binding protein H-NS [Pelomonas aquatica]
MSTSLSKIKNQIAKLQKQAAAIESGVVSRIKAEIAKHGLTAEQLFGASSTTQPGEGGRSAARPKAAKAVAGNVAKFADADGNTWGGMGKRPQWIHDALTAGKSLDDFLVAGKVAAVKTKAASTKAAPAKAEKVVRKAPPAKKVSSAKKTATAKAPVPKRSVKAPAKKAPAKKTVKAAGSAMTASAEAQAGRSS